MLILGRKDERDELGIMIMDCPACQATRPFRVFEEKQKLTLFFIPTFTVDKIHVAVCQVCGETLEIPDKLKADVEKRLMTEAEFKRRLAKTPALPETKICPYCAEEIKAAAVVCRYCKRDLPTES